jgi:FKBP-type peptidyl-prolyl cis-trans isomerase SlyD
MEVARNTVVSLEIELADLRGNLIQRSDALVHYLHGGYDDLLPALERALEGKRGGEELTLRLEPEEAFGEYDEGLLRVEPRTSFPAGLAVGMQFEGVPGGEQDGVIYAVTDIAVDRVVLDGNHPLAGIAIEFRCQIRNVRAATPREVEDGHAAEPDELRVRVADVSP